MLILASLVMTGIFIKDILKSLGGDPIGTFNSGLLWFFAADLVLRSNLQKTPTLNVVPYLRLPVRRKLLMQWLIFRSLPNLFNLLPYIFVLPFTIRILVPALGWLPGCAYLLGITLFVLVNNFLAVFLGFLSKQNLIYQLLAPALLVFLSYSSYFHFSTTACSTALGALMIHGYPLLYLLQAIIIVSLFMLTLHILAPRFYLDEMTPNTSRYFRFGIAGLDNFSSAGDIRRKIWLELTLLYRNKRPRQIIGPVPLLLMIYLTYAASSEKETKPVMYLIYVALASGFLPSLYGQFLFSWESSYFDGLMARKIDLCHYLQSKYYLMVIMALAGFIPIYILLAAISKPDHLVLFSFFVFTIGVTCLIVLYLGIFNDGKVDLGKTQYFNYSSVRGTQFIMTFVFTLLPVGIFEYVKYRFGDHPAEIAIALPGILALLSHKLLIRSFVLPRFKKRKYKNLEGYRTYSI